MRLPTWVLPAALATAAVALLAGRCSMATSTELSPGVTVRVIDGGNHAQFGVYGSQRGDGGAAITAEEQHAQLVAFVTESFAVNGWSR
jgi:hypothetical protein